jgi:Capsule assembly protein Wzi
MPLNHPVSDRAIAPFLAFCLCFWPVCVPAQQPILSSRAIPQDVYIPMDNWVYPALDRLRGLGYLDTAFLGMRPWTRRSISKMLAKADQDDGIHNDPQAEETFQSLLLEFPPVSESPDWGVPALAYESAYTRFRGIAGLPLNDSFHLGQTITNDYGRPYQEGFNNIDGFSDSAQIGRFSLYVRAEYQHAPAATGYSPALFTTLSNLDLVPVASNPVQATIPEGPIPATNVFRAVEASVSYRLLNHEFSFGKNDHWLSPDQGASFLYSNNAENIYAFQIDRTEPLNVPLLSRLTGPFRYLFFVGSLKGHSDPNDPWMHLEKISFKPTANVEIGFSRAAIWGGKDHVPITIHSFLKSFFSFQNVPSAEKFSRADPGARFGTFDFSWRIPFLTHWLTLYTDSLVHDDVSPIDAPRHAGVRPGIYLSEFPGIPRLDLRVEGVNTDPPTARSISGNYLYAEGIQLQGYTNKGNIMGDAFGREGKGGQAWLTYHLSPREMVQLSYQHKKNAKDFIPSGTTQNSFDLRVVKRIHSQWELSADLQQEWWKAPVYKSTQQYDTVATFRLTWFPETVSLQP